MKRIGIFGGTFDPIHFGHLRVALECKQALQLDEMRMMICAQPPHRESPHVPALQRFHMLQIALQNSSELMFDDRELRQQGPSYSVKTLQSLKAEQPDASLFMVIGSDSFQSFDSWYQWEAILELTHLVIARRPDNKDDESSRMGQQLASRFVTDASEVTQTAGQIIPIAVTQLDISATRIRELIAKNISCQYLLPDSVLSFIKNHLLYQSR